ncbi:ABC transporter ATP-binding protein [Pseudomonas agarici]|uniref:ABC transporter ATP-binding protein n=1 Tax=Pseudomonas agarici TaxID=46677 RepID=UPI0002F437F6|nr:ABC transporter ATP-binding protein [Pseudomonas agarici]NWB91435.1 ABC transporter ATP-binding protein [Pseudomonas agarici]NWC07817.1 ABC transporter ATP-binding protein [Pseudomonas agarici]SEK75263.1 iron(III) transport system ATP-binding protein [Pseudomonas agarici]
MLNVKALCTEYPNEKGEIVKAAQDISFEVPQGKLFTLLGPSGCGKTTTLRSIAGLERPNSGEILVGDVAVYSSSKKIFVTPNKRNFGMVFQSYAIWPHMNVFQNTAFPLEVGTRKFTKRQIEEKVMRVLTAVGLDHVADREATKMSGGQQQRLALARALVMEPKLLLLDEPLSNLDAKLRERMRFELKRMQRELGLTTIYVTHDQSEALALSHEIAVMNAGRIVQIGSPRDIYERPRDKFVADFVGLTNFLEATVEVADNLNSGYRVSSTVGQLNITSLDPLERANKVLISVRPEDVELFEQRPEGLNVLEGIVDFKVFLGEYMDFQVKVGSQQLLARVHPSLKTVVGQKIYVRMNPEKCLTIHDAVLKSAA